LVVEVDATLFVFLDAPDDGGPDVVVFLPILSRCPQVPELPNYHTMA